MKVKANQFGEEFHLTDGKIYNVIENIGRRYYKVENDLGIEELYTAEYFEIVED